VAAAALVAAAPRRAAATEFEVQGATAFQAYEVAGPWGDLVVERRRFTQTLGLALYDLQGDYRPGQADYRVVMMLRLDSDFGINANLPSSQAGGETTYATPAGNGVRFIPGLQENALDLMYGYVEGRNLAHGLFGFRLGRQYMTDVLGWWSFDGGLARFTTPFFVEAQVYGGLEQRGGLPLSTGRFEQQGVWRGSHAGFGGGADQPSTVDYPSYLYAEMAPAFGFAAETTGLKWVHARASYRRVYNTGPVLTTQFPEPNGAGFHLIDGTRISSDRAGISADLGKPDLGNLRGGMSYDLYNQLVSTYYANVEGYLGKRATIGADLDYFVPTFDADSIFNWFAHGPVTTVTGRAAVRFTRRFDVSASGGLRLWQVEGDPSPVKGGLSAFGAGECAAAQKLDYAGTLDCRLGNVTLDPSQVASYTQSPNLPTVTTADGLGNLAARYRFGLGDVGLRGMFETGSRGSREGADLSGELRFDGGRYTAGSHVSLYGWDDPTRPDRDAVSFAYTLAAGFKPARFAKFRLEWEHDTNRLVGQRYRLVGLVDLLVVR
jgi:hypothetical protein